ncbi:MULTISPECIES: hypothetical protein [Pseudomonas]|uniref:Uncharacterized protein n=1 Tax=Pseudomonas tehranensis TaxID=2745502 RepID=A0ABR6USL7_9PSED|nr:MULTISPECIES: hypothetical protein [Pseudomonas]MBC3347547.1 hypothetical protein [Pseudomonas tehranensis]SEN58800.1 hypothetical protein SAMN03159293_00435 [Pseudomonas sp. NFACC39-1]SFH08063.1 hypothetical protein SAMN03159297_02941 [Pseudomonas sp. NFACC45]
MIFVTAAKKTVGAGLLAKTAVHSTSMKLTHRFREQARSHRDCTGLVTIAGPCANEDGGMLNPRPD